MRTPRRLLRRRQETIHGDVHHRAAFSMALVGCGRPQRNDAGATEAFGEAAARADLTRIICLGRLGWTAPTPCRHTCAAAAGSGS